MCKYLYLFLFCVFSYTININNEAVAASDNKANASSSVQQEGNDVSYEYDLDNDDERTNSSKVSKNTSKKKEKSKQSGNKIKEALSMGALKPKMDTKFSAGVGVGIFGLGGKKKIGVTSFLGVKFLFKYSDLAILFMNPEFQFDYASLSFDNGGSNFSTYNGYPVSLVDSKTYGGGFLLNVQKNTYTKYSEETAKSAITKTSESYINELVVKNVSLLSDNAGLREVLGSKEAASLSESADTGTLYDRQRYLSKQISDRQTLLDDYKNGNLNADGKGYNNTNSVGYELWQKYQFINGGYEEDAALASPTTELGKTYKALQTASKGIEELLDSKTAYKATAEGEEKTFSEWLNSITDPSTITENNLKQVFLHYALLIQQRDTANNKYSEALETEKQALATIATKISSAIDAFQKQKNELDKDIESKEATVTANEKTIDDNISLINTVYSIPSESEYSYTTTSFTSNVSYMFAYSTKFGVDIKSISPYLKLSFGGMATSNTMVKETTYFKELLLDPEKLTYGLYYLDSKTSTETKKNISLMYGVGCGILFKISDFFNVFVEFDYRSSRYTISFEGDIEKTFVHNMKTLSTGISVLF